jgi:AhpD family alkylhydroperoxidase
MNSRIEYARHAPEAFKHLVAIDNSLKGSPIGAGLIDLIKIRVSQLNGCIFCVDLHSKEARKRGEQELRLHHLAFWRESRLFGEREKAALAWAELLTRIGKDGVGEEDFRAVSGVFSEKEVSDLTFAVGSINLWNRIGVAFRPLPGSKDALMGLENAFSGTPAASAA